MQKSGGRAAKVARRNVPQPGHIGPLGNDVLERNGLSHRAIGYELARSAPELPQQITGSADLSGRLNCSSRRARKALSVATSDGPGTIFRAERFFSIQAMRGSAS
jgi:hypothetical protein